MTAPVRMTPGSELGDFRLDRKLALGGMAEIWIAWEGLSTSRRKVALKLLQVPFSGDPEFRGMFRDEVSIARRLHHRNIVRTHDVHEVQGQLFSCMELIDGLDVRRIQTALARQGRRWPVPLALYVLRELAEALAYAHERKGDDGRPLGIVHRDVSPHNIMVSADGAVKLLDFGVAHAKERLTRTRTGVIKGKVAYMAPEQALGSTVSPRTDIFAAGIVLWEMLAGRRLFDASSDPENIDRIVRADVPKVEPLASEVPSEVKELVGHMLKQHARERPVSMQRVAEALGRILARQYAEEAIGAQALAAFVGSTRDDVAQRRAAPTARAIEECGAPTASTLGDPLATTALDLGVTTEAGALVSDGVKELPDTATMRREPH